MVGNFATSLAGHDKNQLYIIIREDKEYVYLCDGKGREITNPKRKNKRHIQIIKAGTNEDLAVRLAGGELVCDEEIKRTIKLYEQKRSKQI